MTLLSCCFSSLGLLLSLRGFVTCDFNALLCSFYVLIVCSISQCYHCVVLQQQMKEIAISEDSTHFTQQLLYCLLNNILISFHLKIQNRSHFR